jgi:hypothetical protein
MAVFGVATLGSATGCSEPALGADGGLDAAVVDAGGADRPIPGWVTPQNVQISGQISGGPDGGGPDGAVLDVAEVGPTLATGPNERVAVAWIALAQGTRVETALSDDDGRTFRATGLAPLEAGEQESDPDLAISASGEIHLVYLAGTGGAAHAVWHTRWDPVAGQWAARTRVDDGTSAIRDAPWIGIAPDGGLVVVYREDPLSPSGRLWVARSDDGGATFGSRTLAPPGEVAVLAVDNAGRVHLAYVDDAMDVHYLRSDDGGRTLGAPSAPLGRSETPARARLATRGGTVYIAYLDARPAVVLLRSIDDHSGATPTFSSTTVIEGTGARASFMPTVALPGAHRVVVGFYLAPDQITGRYAAALSEDDGATFSLPLSVSDADMTVTPDRSWPDWLGDYTQVVEGADALLCAWTDNRAGASHIFFARLTP